MSILSGCRWEDKDMYEPGPIVLVYEVPERYWILHRTGTHVVYYIIARLLLQSLPRTAIDR